MVQWQNRTGTDLLGLNEGICCAPQPQGRLGSTLAIPGRRSPVVKSSREGGQASVFLLSKPNIGFVSVVSPEHFYSLNLWPLFTCGHREQFCGSTGLSLYDWGMLSSHGRALAPEGAQGSALSPSCHGKRKFKEQHWPVPCPLVASAAGAEPASVRSSKILCDCKLRHQNNYTNEQQSPVRPGASCMVPLGHLNCY